MSGINDDGCRLLWAQSDCHSQMSITSVTNSDLIEWLHWVLSGTRISGVTQLPHMCFQLECFFFFLTRTILFRTNIFFLLIYIFYFPTWGHKHSLSSMQKNKLVTLLLYRQSFGDTVKLGHILGFG